MCMRRCGMDWLRRRTYGRQREVDRVVSLAVHSTRMHDSAMCGISESRDLYVFAVDAP